MLITGPNMGGKSCYSRLGALQLSVCLFVLPRRSDCLCLPLPAHQLPMLLHLLYSPARLPTLPCLPG